METETIGEIASSIASERWFKMNYLNDGDFCFTVPSYVDTIKTKISDTCFFDHSGEYDDQDKDAIYTEIVATARGWNREELESELFG